jgi:hypothetical protein
VRYPNRDKYRAPNSNRIATPEEERRLLVPETLQ